MNVVPTLSNFFELFIVKVLMDMRYYLNPYTKYKLFCMSLSNHSIRSRFFFIKMVSLEDWEFPTIFKKMDTPKIE